MLHLPSCCRERLLTHVELPLVGINKAYLLVVLGVYLGEGIVSVASEILFIFFTQFFFQERIRRQSTKLSVSVLIY